MTASEGNHCVYSHAANGRVFYVGSGSRRRAYSKYGRTQRWHAHVAKNPAYEVQIIRETDDRDEAFAIEKQLIKELYPATNVTGKSAVMFQMRVPEEFLEKLDD